MSANALSDVVTASKIEDQIKKFHASEDITAKAASISQTSNGVIVHEIGHIFGMLHDTKDPRNIMMRGYDNLGKMYQCASRRFHVLEEFKKASIASWFKAI